MIPQNYREWHYCITIECGLALTTDFIRERLAVWRDEKAFETSRFRELYGDAHWQAVIGWFEQAQLLANHPVATHQE